MFARFALCGVPILGAAGLGLWLDRQAVIAAEDRDFYSHGGVDVRGTMRALIADLRNRETSQGGSTITQQLVKNTVTGGERSFTRKIREAVLASQLEHDRKLLAGTGGEWLPPPTVLHIADRRERYDVMTMECAELYANVFHLGGDESIPKTCCNRFIVVSSGG